MKLPRLLVIALCLLLPSAIWAQTTVHIGVLAFNGAQQARARWQSTADYLGDHIQGYRFVILPLTHEAFRNRIRKGQLDFILTNPAHYVRLEVSFGATRIATFRNRFGDRILTHFAAVLFSRADSEIRNLDDLPGHSLAAVNEEAFGGFLLARKLLRDAGVDALHDMRPLWLGFPQTDIVRAVVDGRADVGTVRSGILENLFATGAVDPASLKILAPRENDGFPLLHSTDLYPEWPFARLPQTDEALARAVAITLLQMPADSPPARAAGGAGWTIPLDYNVVHHILRELQIAPYLPQPVRWSALWRAYRPWILMLAMAFASLLLAALLTWRMNRVLKISKRELERHQNELEKLVDQRTQALITTNTALKQDIESRVQHEEALHGGCDCMQHFHALITRDDLTREQRLQSIVDLMQQYFDAEQVLLTRCDGEHLVACASSPTQLSRQAPLQPDVADSCIGEPGLMERDLQLPGEQGERRYLICPVFMQGRVACLIEFLSPLLVRAGEAERLSISNELSMRILQLMAQWLGHENNERQRELERNQAAERLAQLTPREREVMQWVAAGTPNKQIARELGISIKTVELHRANLMRKAGVHSAAELARITIAAGCLMDRKSSFKQ